LRSPAEGLAGVVISSPMIFGKTLSDALVTGYS
jgi:hypothetical protein